MPYKKQGEAKYKHYTTNEKILLGVPVNFTKEEASLFALAPLQINGSLYDKVARLNTRDSKIVMAALAEWESEVKTEAIFSGTYWDVLLDFIFVYYKKTAYDLAKELEAALEETEKGKYDGKYFYDAIDKKRSGKASLRKEGLELVRKICHYCKVTDEIVRTGEGVLYVVKDGGAYTLDAIQDYYKKHGQDVDLRKMIADITGVEGDAILEVPLQIAIEKKALDARVYRFAEMVIDKMLENRA